MNKILFTIRKYLPGLVLVMLCIGTANGQNKMKEYSNARVVRPASIDTYLDSAQLLTNKAPLRAIDQINKAIELSIRYDDKNNEALSYCILGNIQQNLEQHDLAIENYEKCIHTLSVNKSFKSDYSSNSIGKVASKKMEKFAGNDNIQTASEQPLFTAYKRMAFSLMRVNRFAEAALTISYCFTDTFLFIPNDDKQDAKRLQADISLKQGKQDESLSILLNTLEEEKRQGNPEGEVKTLMSIASFYQQIKKETKAIEYYQLAKTAAEKINHAELLLNINNALAPLFRQQKNTDKELEARTNSMEISNTLNKKMDAATKEPDPRIITSMDVASNSSGSILQKEKFDDATLAEPLFGKSNDLEYTANTYKLLAEQYLKEGNHTKALAYLKTFVQIQDSIKLIRKRELDQALKVSNALGKNQQRIDLLEKERNLSERSIEVLKQDRELKENELFVRNIIIGTLLFLILFMLVGSYYIFKSIRAKKKANQLLAIKSLRGQMNPHFIFNALNSVNHYISQNNELAANKYLSDFSKLMRAVMETSKHDLISLAEELDILKIYLQLEHSRFKDKFDYIFHIDEQIDASEFELPPMIIQPFIENAVWHGVRYINEKGLLEISITQKNSDLLITVSDNGIGRAKSLELKTKNQKLQHSTGMQNIESRITIMNELFKTNIRVVIADAYPSAENTGTRVEIFIPKKINDHA